MPLQQPPARSLLPHFLALLYTLAIIYASLQPFSPWIAPLPETRFFLFAPWPTRWTRFDAIANAIAYLPLGLFAALLRRGQSPLGRLLMAISAGTLLSLALETAQMFMPPRDASVIDLMSNVTGATVGGVLAITFAGLISSEGAIARFRQRWFLPGTVGDLGLALITIWLVVQVNPGIPLFTSTFDPSIRPEPTALGFASSGEEPDGVALLVESAHSAFQLLGVGLFVALLLRERRYVGGAVLVLLGAALLVKGVAAAVLLKPAVWEHWLSPGVATGVATGALFLLSAIWMPRPVQVALASIALLSSLLITLLVPDVLFARAPLSAFNWSYGHLLNFNGLTHTVLLVWPIIATIFLFALAGRPGWGDPR